MLESKIITIFPVNITMNNLGRNFTEKEKESFTKYTKDVKNAVTNTFSSNNKIVDDTELIDIKKLDI